MVFEGCDYKYDRQLSITRAALDHTPRPRLPFCSSDKVVFGRLDLWRARASPFGGSGVAYIRILAYKDTSLEEYIVVLIILVKPELLLCSL